MKIYGKTASFLLAVGRQSAELLFGGPPLGPHGGGTSARSGGGWSTRGAPPICVKKGRLCQFLCQFTMEQLSTTAMAVLKALASSFHGMSRKSIAKYASKELEVDIHGRNDLGRLLPAMSKSGLIYLDKQTWLITENGRRALPEEPQEKAQVICFAYYLLSRSCPDHFSCPGR